MTYLPWVQFDGWLLSRTAVFQMAWKALVVKYMHAQFILSTWMTLPTTTIHTRCTSINHHSECKIASTNSTPKNISPDVNKRPYLDVIKLDVKSCWRHRQLHLQNLCKGCTQLLIYLWPQSTNGDELPICCWVFTPPKQHWHSSSEWYHYILHSTNIALTWWALQSVEQIRWENNVCNLNPKP